MGSLTNTSFTRPGAVGSGTSDEIELFLRVFSGEVAEAYEKASVMLPRSRVRRIQNGKSATFPATGTLTAGYFAAGTDITEAEGTGNRLQVGERLIYVDRILRAWSFVDSLEEMMNHYDVRGPISRKIGYALADTADSQLLKLVALGAQSASGPITAQPGGTVLSGTDIPELATADTDGSALMEGLRQAAQVLDELNVPKMGRYCAVLPAQYYRLVEQTEFINRDLGNEGNGSLRQGEIMRAWGFQILMSNNVPTTDTSGGSDDNQHGGGNGNSYLVDATNTVALCWQEDAVGTVRIKDVNSVVHNSPLHGGTFLIGEIGQGHGVLREEACIQIVTATP